jgi:hypothetical protein
MFHDMNILSFNTPIIKTKLQDHKILKEMILSQIEKMNCDSDQKDFGETKITKTDWFMPKEIERGYFNILSPALIKAMNPVYEALQHDHWKIQNYWFQQYKKNDHHTWHQHRGSSWANVYYLQYKSTNPATEMKKFLSNELITIDVEEGDILTFPSTIWHRSNLNASDDTKTVIAFNVY